MAVTLALVEGSWIFAAVCAVSVLGHPLLKTWADVATLVSRAFTVSVCCLLALYYAGLYDFRMARSVAGFVSRLPRSLALTVVMFAGLYAFLPDSHGSWRLFAGSLTASVALLVPLRAISYRLMRSPRFLARVLIVGASPLAHKLIEEIEAQPHFGYAVIGVADDATARSVPPHGYPLLGPLAHLGKIVEEVEPDRIIIALAERRGLPMTELVEFRARGILVEDGAEVYERLTGKLALESLTPSDLVFCKSLRKSCLELAVVRGISFIASVVALVGLVPLLTALAVAIKLDSRGPVFFIQDRVGPSGRRFRLIKFRTMHPAHRETSEWVQDNVDRITRIGKWLRKFRLDELPQFLNILRGDMNLVGPRPHPVSNFKLFTEHIPYYCLRALVRPGVTGWAQIRYGYANSLEEETEKMRYDLYYVKHMSIWLDLRILLDTVKIMLSGRGSEAADACELDRREGLRAG